jgi:hypothetical protein
LVLLQVALCAYFVAVVAAVFFADEAEVNQPFGADIKLTMQVAIVVCHFAPPFKVQAGLTS